VETVRILLLEDSPLDADLIQACLARDAIAGTLERVADRPAFLAALQRQPYDLILAEYYLPGFDGLEALEAARQRHPETPFVFVSGRLGEEVAIDALRRGATDYVLKDRLARLGPAVRRALAESRARAERRAAQEALKEANRRKDEFMAVLGHELRNLLAPVRNAIEVLRQKPDEESTVRWAADVLDRQCRHQARLVDDLLDLSRIGRGKLRMEPVRLDLAGLLRAAAEDQRSTLEEAGLTLDVAVPAEAVWVRGDATRLTQVLGNLLANARKFTEPGGRVAVGLAVDRHTSRAAVSVRDTGVGIEPEMMPHLFEAFAQAEGSLQRNQDGLGLGLALVRGLVQLHGGEIRAASEGPGRGSTFTFWLPLAQEAGTCPAAPARPVEQGKPLKILVIDDQRDAADSLRLLLEFSGHEVAVAYTGPEGVELAQHALPDVVLCDLGLPGMSGLEVARALRADPATARARLIAVSGFALPPNGAGKPEADFDAHLTKPVELGDLQRLLAEPAAAVA
jgi:signal transduction histidine kinase